MYLPENNNQGTQSHPHRIYMQTIFFVCDHILAGLAFDNGQVHTGGGPSCDKWVRRRVSVKSTDLRATRLYLPFLNILEYSRVNTDLHTIQNYSIMWEDPQCRNCGVGGALEPQPRSWSVFPCYDSWAR